jgi:ribosome-associated protein
MIELGGLLIPEGELSYELFRKAAGPGGQNVNKVATAVRLRFAAGTSAALAPEVRERLLRLAGKRATAEGDVVITAQRFRTQERNRQDALDRLAHLLERAAAPPRPRFKTRPTRAAKEKRLREKKVRASTKASRAARPELD